MTGRRRRGPATVAVAAMVLAVVVGGMIAEGGLPRSAPALEAAGVEYACPPGAEPRPDGLCVGVFSSTTESHQEPYLAADPTRPGVFALGVNLGETTRAPDAGVAHPGADVLRLAVFVTEDGGGSWREVRFPHVHAPTLPGNPRLTMAGDPALAFDDAGVLHVTGILTHRAYVSGNEYAWDVFHVATPDLGLTWSEPTLLTVNEMADRNWHATAPGGGVFATWRLLFGRSHFAWSPDGGATWTAPSDAWDKLGCRASMSPVLVNGVFLASCAAVWGEAGQATPVAGFNPATGASFLAGLAPDAGGWTYLAPIPGGPLVLVGSSSDAFVAAWTSGDGGATWTGPVDLLARSAVAAAWEGAIPMWAAADPWGNVHLLAREVGGSVERPAVRGVLHMAFTPDFEIAAEKILVPSDPLHDPVPDSLAPRWGDHFFGIAFQEGAGLLAWTRDGTVAYTVVRPGAS